MMSAIRPIARPPDDNDVDDDDYDVDDVDWEAEARDIQNRMLDIPQTQRR